MAFLESSTPSNRTNLQKKAINSSKRYHISHSQSFTSAIIDGPAVNGLLLVVEVFTVFFHHFFLILFLQGEANCKRDNTDNSENVTKKYVNIL
jgi:hypothetical protein